MNRDQIDWVKSLRKGDHKTFRKLFDLNFQHLCSYLYRMNANKQLCEDLCQEVFIDLWNKRKEIVIHTSIEAYMKRAARNKFLNHIRGKKNIWDSLEENQHVEHTYKVVDSPMEMDELRVMITDAIDRLPPRCRLVFSLSRFEDMSYKQIAVELGISIKTVENQMSKALSRLRKEIYGNG